MKTVRNSMKSNPRLLNRPRGREPLYRDDATGDGIAARRDSNRIQWPTPQELQRVSTTLTRVSRWGMRQEEAGDYFNSGDLAYQLQEIIRATNELLKKSRRPRMPIRG